MRANRALFVIFCLVITVAGYIVVFGDAGYMVYHRSSQRLMRMEAELHQLGRENRILQDRYERLLETPQPAEEVTATGFTIFKFETDQPPQTGLDSDAFRPGDEITLIEARALYLSAMLFLTLVGTLLLGRRPGSFVKVAGQGEGKKMDNQPVTG